MRQVIVANAGQGIVIVQDCEVGRQTERSRGRIACLRTDLLVIIEAGAEINPTARAAFSFAGYGKSVAGAKRHRAEADVAPQLALLRTSQARRRKDRIAGVSPHVAVAAAQRELGGGVEEDIDLLL